MDNKDSKRYYYTENQYIKELLKGDRIGNTIYCSPELIKQLGTEAREVVEGKDFELQYEMKNIISGEWKIIDKSYYDRTPSPTKVTAIPAKEVDYDQYINDVSLLYKDAVEGVEDKPEDEFTEKVVFIGSEKTVYEFNKEEIEIICDALDTAKYYNFATQIRKGEPTPIKDEGKYSAMGSQIVEVLGFTKAHNILQIIEKFKESKEWSERLANRLKRCIELMRSEGIRTSVSDTLLMEYNEYNKAEK